MDRDKLTERLHLRFSMLDRAAKGYLSISDFNHLADRIIASLGLPPESAKRAAIVDGHHRYWSGLEPVNGQVSRDRYVQTVQQPTWFREHMLPCAEAVGVGADHDDDGYLNEDNWTALLSAIGFPQPQAAVLFQAMDDDGDGLIPVQRWLSTTEQFYTGASAGFAGDLLLEIT